MVGWCEKWGHLMTHVYPIRTQHFALFPRPGRLDRIVMVSLPNQAERVVPRREPISSLDGHHLGIADSGENTKHDLWLFTMIYIYYHIYR